MEQRNTCISALRLEVSAGHIRIFVEQAGRWYLIVDEDMLTRSLTLTALQIDKIVGEADDQRYLASVARGPAGDAQGAS